MKVLHLTSGNLFGGIETYLLTLAGLRHLCPTMEPHFGVCFPGRLRDELIATGAPVHDFGAVRVSRPWTVLRARSRLKRLLTAPRFDAAITHGTWPHAVFAPAVKRAGIRLINAVHGELSGKHWIDRWAARTRPDGVIANSRFTASSAERVFPVCPTDVVHPPVPAPPEFDRKEARSTIRAECSTDEDAIVILIVSRIEAIKGHAVLFEALAELRNLAGWVCWVVGGAQRPSEVALLAYLKATAQELGLGDRIEFFGPRSDAAQLMKVADIYCQPNTGPEGFGIAFVEALWARLPVITSDFGGGAEIVDRECGILCPSGDSRAVATALRELIENPIRRRTLGDAGPSRAAERCDPSARLAEMARLIAPRAFE